MAGLDPAIHVFLEIPLRRGCRDLSAKQRFVLTGITASVPAFAGTAPGSRHSVPIVVRSWNQCCACTNFFTRGDSACGLVS